MDKLLIDRRKTCAQLVQNFYWLKTLYVVFRRNIVTKYGVFSSLNPYPFLEGILILKSLISLNAIKIDRFAIKDVA